MTFVHNQSSASIRSFLLDLNLFYDLFLLLNLSLLFDPNYLLARLKYDRRLPESQLTIPYIQPKK